MTENEFLNEEFEFLEKVKSSSLYQRMITLSKQIDTDKRLVSIAEERDSFLQQAEKEKDSIRKKELLLSFNKKDNELRETPLMAEYLSLYQTLRLLLTRLADSLTKEINSL